MTLSFVSRQCPALVAALLLAAAAAHAQAGGVGIGTPTPNAAAALDITSTTKGLLLPRLTLAQRDALTASTTAPPVPGLVIYQTTNTPGLYAYDGTTWVRLAADNLGSHTATQNLNLATYQLVGNGGSSGLSVSSAGNVGIGTTTPGQKLVVQEADFQYLNDLVKAQSFNQASAVSLYYQGLRASGNNANDPLYLDSKGTGSLALNANSGSGNVGIGLTNPGAKLDVSGSIGASGSVVVDKNGSNDGTTTTSMLRLGGLGSGEGLASKRTPTGNQYGLDFYTASANRLSIDVSGNVGVGTTTPSTRLEVAGQVKISGGSPGSGKVLTSDANGLASWQAVTGATTANSIQNQSSVEQDASFRINGSAAVGGTTYLNGPAFLNNTATLNGTTTIGGATTINGTATLTNGLTARGNVGINTEASQAGNTTIGNASIGDLALAGGSASLRAYGALQLSATNGSNYLNIGSNGIAANSTTTFSLSAPGGITLNQSGRTLSVTNDGFALTGPGASAVVGSNYVELLAGGNGAKLSLKGNSSVELAGSSGVTLSTTYGNVSVPVGNVLVATGSVGVGTTSPGSTLQVAGSVAANIRTLASGTIADNDYTVLLTGNVSLPTPSAANTGRLYHLLNGGTGSPFVTGAVRDAGTPSGGTGIQLGTGTGIKGLTVQSDGTQWWILTRE